MKFKDNSHVETLPVVNTADNVDLVAAVLSTFGTGDYYAYERYDAWYVGLDAQETLIIGPDGRDATRTFKNGSSETFEITSGSLGDVARQFMAESSIGNKKVFGQVGFNYAAHVGGLAYIPGKWPLLSLMVPQILITLDNDEIVITAACSNKVKALSEFLQSEIQNETYKRRLSLNSAIDVYTSPDEYKARVERCLSEIRKGKFTKIVPSRTVDVGARIDMPATLRKGRHQNSPSRTFCFSQDGIQATGFSPEIVLASKADCVFTEAVAGTRLARISDTEAPTGSLTNDPKEVVEHVLAVKSAVGRLSEVCPADSIQISDFLTVINRGNVQHLFSRVSGKYTEGQDFWEALPPLISSVTAPTMHG